ncbi:MAG: anthranilate phosphoribosyltransferase, partial [Acidimicrobiales bacterium]
ARAMLAAAEQVHVPHEVHAQLVDTCGTGGDRSGTINVSTLAALVVAGAGVPVCKHGNRAASSRAGSADVLEALGVAIDLDPEGVAACIQTAGIGFCFAPRYHKALRHASATRAELGVPTAFNFLGPLANPARVTRQVVGVGDPTMAETMVGVLASNGARHVIAVYGADGLDELSTTGPSTMIEWAHGVMTSSVIDPVELGLPCVELSSLRGGDAATNADLARRVLQGERGPRRDVVLLNAAAALVAADVVDDLGAGLQKAEASLDSGKAAAALEALIATSQQRAARQ